MAAQRNVSNVLRLAHCAELAANDVHVWQLSVEHCRAFIPGFQTLLSSDERRQADKFAYADSRNQFTIARASLRLILGGYLRERANVLRFVYGQYGKPALVSDESLRFNVAHSKDAVLIAVAQGFDIGVDVEYCRNDVEPEQLAPQCLDAAEIGRIGALDPERQRAAFFDSWTCKEALSKAVGLGLAAPLTAIHVREGNDRVVEMMWCSDASADQWFAYRLDVGPEYSAAVAARSPSHRVTVFGTDWGVNAERTFDL